MQANQITNSDLLALLSGSATKGTKGAGSSDSVLGEFSQLLETQGSLEGLSSDDLLNFFKRGNGQQENSAIDELMSKLQSSEGQDLLKSLNLKDGVFTNQEGEVLDPKSMLQKLNVSEDVSESLTRNNPINTKSSNSLKSQFNHKMPNVEGTQNLSLKKNVNNSPDVKSAEDFLAQRNALQNKAHVQIQNNRPVLKNINPGLSQYRKESIVTDKRVIRSNSIDGFEPQVESSSDFQMSEVFEGNGENQLEIQNLQTSKNSSGKDSQFSTKVQVVDISQISAENKTELINKVSGYIEQSYVAGQDSVEMVVKHEELGHFRVAANRTGAGQQIDLEINAMSKEGHQFFVDNESELIKSLTQNGVKISDFKITANSELVGLTEGKSQLSDNSSQGQGSSESSSQSQYSQKGQGQESSNQERRRQLWKNAQEHQQSFQAA